MSDSRALILTITRMEAAYLADLVGQFISLLDDYSDEREAPVAPASAGAGAIAGAFGGAQEIPEDPALARLMPDAYADDVEASAEFRRHTENELLARRIRDARRVLSGLDMSLNEPVVGAASAEAKAAASDDQLPFDVVLDPASAEAWTRTLAAVRLVVASRLGIETEADDAAARAADDDGRFGVYDWLGYRLDGIVQALDDADGADSPGTATDADPDADADGEETHR